MSWTTAEIWWWRFAFMSTDAGQFLRREHIVLDRRQSRFPVQPDEEWPLLASRATTPLPHWEGFNRILYWGWGVRTTKERFPVQFRASHNYLITESSVFLFCSLIWWIGFYRLTIQKTHKHKSTLSLVWSLKRRKMLIIVFHIKSRCLQMFHFHSARLFSWRMTRIEEFLLLRGRNVGSFGHFEVSSHKQGSPRYFSIALSLSLSFSLSQRDFLSERKRERKSDDMILPPGGQSALLPRTPVSDWKSFYFVECYLFIYLPRKDF